MPEEKTEKKQTSPLIYIAIGCVALLFLIGAGTTIFFRFFAKRMIQGAIENKTGIKTNLSGLEQGKMTFTDTKTGAQVNVGSGQIPDTFPKDFPVYPGAKVTSSLAGAQAGKNNGFWLTLSTPDSVDKVTSFYKTQLAANGWTVESTFTANNTLTESVTKTGWSGSLAVTSENNQTQMVIILGQDNATPTPQTSGSGY